jgi:hypothetical protein
MIVGDSQRFSATARDVSGQSAGARRLTWTSSDNRVASVSARGTVFGLAPGRATITATTDGGTRGTAAVSVSQAAAGVLRVLLTTWANVTVDGNGRGQPSHLEIPVSSRTPHVLRFERVGYETVDTTVILQPGETLTLRINMKQRTP